jgi:ectoine hydroxylase
VTHIHNKNRIENGMTIVNYEDSLVITKQDIEHYQEKGYLLLPSFFTKDEVDTMLAELPGLYSLDDANRVLENDGKTVRGVHGPHLRNQVFRRLVRLPKLLKLAEQLLEGQVYVHQFKINAKQGMAGEVWEWHQDFTYWQIEDGMPEPMCTSMAIFLDEVTEFNGPLLFLPGSHRAGLYIVNSATNPPKNYEDKEQWIGTLTAKLKHTMDKENVKRLVQTHGMVAPKGPAGSLLIFHPNIVHGSVQNISPFDRNLAIIAYNRIDNVLNPVKSPRPEFLACRDYTPLEPLEDSVLLG